MSEEQIKALSQFTSWQLLFHLWWKRPIAIVMIATLITALMVIGGFCGARLNDVVNFTNWTSRLKYTVTDYPATRAATLKNSDSINSFTPRISALEAGASQQKQYNVDFSNALTNTDKALAITSWNQEKANNFLKKHGINIPKP